MEGCRRGVREGGTREERREKWEKKKKKKKKKKKRFRCGEKLYALRPDTPPSRAGAQCQRPMACINAGSYHTIPYF